MLIKCSSVSSNKLKNSNESNSMSNINYNSNSNSNKSKKSTELGALIANMASNNNGNLNINNNINSKSDNNYSQNKSNIESNKLNHINQNNSKMNNNNKTSPNILNSFSNLNRNLNLNLILNQQGIKRRFSETYYKSIEHHKRPRLVKKCGELNIHMGNVPKHKRRLLSDFFNTILDMKWRWHLIIFMLSFLVSWFIFATIWYSIAFIHGDLNHENISSNLGTSLPTPLINNSTYQELVKPLNHTSNKKARIEILNKSSLLISRVIKNLENEDANILFNPFENYHLPNKTQNKTQKHIPCVHGIHNFMTALLYSVETQHTIGYGLRYITEECPLAIGFLMLQSCFGIFVQGLVAGVVFAKISRPNKRKRTIIFSHNAVVSERDGKLCFMFKIGNVRISQLSDAKLKVLMIKSRRTSEGEFIPFQTYDMKVGYDWSGNNNVFFPWPKTVEHVIDEDSPFYEMCKHVISKKNTYNSFKDQNSTDTEPCNISSSSTSSSTSELLTQPTIPISEVINQPKHEDYEIVVMLEGNIETTGASCHIRTSYLPQEILFGYRFVPIYPKFTDFEYFFDYSKFDQVEPFNLNLLHLNTAYLNRDLNYVYDARNENKNYQITFQNTLQNPMKELSYMNRSNYKQQPPASILSILNSFKVYNQDKDKTKEANIIEGNEALCTSPNGPGGEDIKGKNLRQNFNSNDNTSINANTISTCVAESKTDICQRISVEKSNKNGRFTVVPVSESNGKLESPVSNRLKQAKQVIFNNGRNSLMRFHLKQNHQRTNSLPPIYSASLFEQTQSKLSNIKNTHKQDSRNANRTSFFIN